MYMSVHRDQIDTLFLGLTKIVDQVSANSLSSFCSDTFGNTRKHFEQILITHIHQLDSGKLYWHMCTFLGSLFHHEPVPQPVALVQSLQGFL